MRGLSLVAASGGHSSSRCAGPSLSRPLSLRGTGSRRAGSVVVAHGPSCSAACGILPDQGSNRVPCIGRQTLNHCATGEAPTMSFRIQPHMVHSFLSTISYCYTVYPYSVWEGTIQELEYQETRLTGDLLRSWLVQPALVWYHIQKKYQFHIQKH